jgi:rfaE bifunctional protein kinase chain/domain/rfaE bifunctional protein nucleotidyltransferase chain/domain
VIGESALVAKKIKTRDELKKILGDRPRAKKVIMCHGTFDIVHPGHVRHLMYAKSKADILVASVTCDKFVSKANYRPYVPEDIRAMNLAAFEIVDYVVIDRNETPIETIQELKPDYFVKGYEYVSSGVPKKTQEEMDALASYGGEIIFSPGDIVYSSSNLIESKRPDLSCEKLLSLMKGEGISFADLKNCIKKFENIRVHVTGDTIVDTYTYGSLIGSGTKTPTPSIRYGHHVDYVGGAAVVAKHIRKTGAKVHFSTVLGDDGLKDFVIKDLQEAGVDCHAEVDPTRPTTRKNAFIADGYRLLKLDTVDNRAISDKILEKMVSDIKQNQADAFVLSDFRHGIFTKHTIPVFTNALPQGAFKVADSQVASRWGNILEFKGFDLITPNEKEARFALADQDSVVRPLALNLYEQANCKYLILKMGERGMMTYRNKDQSDPRACFTISTFVRHLVDAVGAGDALLAYATLGIVATKSEVVGSILGSMAAAVACESEGNNPVEPSAVIKIIESYEREAVYQQ